MIWNLTLRCVMGGIVVVVDVDVENDLPHTLDESSEEDLDTNEETNIYEKIKQILTPKNHTLACSLTKKAATSIASSISLKSSSLPIPIPYQKAFE